MRRIVRPAGHALWLFFCLALVSRVSAQISLSQKGVPVTETFDAMLGTSATATLTADQWRAADNLGGTTWSGANRLATTQLGGTAAAVSTGGFYNYGNGTAASATDRALGFLSSGTAPWPGTAVTPLSIYAQYQNATGSTVSQVSVGFDFEKYRNGTNANGWSFFFYYSLDGTNWTNVSAANQTYIADLNNTAVSPASTISKAVTITGLAIPNNTTFYLRWSYFVSAGTTATNAQGLAIDNVSVAVNSSDNVAPALSASPSSLSFPTTFLNNTSTAQYALTAADLSDDVTITTAAPFSVSADNQSFGASLTVSKSDAALAGGKTIYVKFAPTTAGVSNGTISHSSPGADTKTVALSGTGVGLITLAAPPYVQNFNGIANGLPMGISVRTGATASALGSNAAYTSTATAWNNTSGAFKNFASGNNDLGVTQASATDRALGVRQTGSFGDPGAAFVFQVANTTGKINFTLDFNLQSLDVNSERVTTWRVDYGFGVNPTVFTPATTTGELTTGGLSFTNNPVHVDFGSALDNKTGVVTIRVVALSASSGANNRPSSAVDDLTLNWEDPNAETLSLSATTLNFETTAIGQSSTASYTLVKQTNLTAAVVLTTAAPFALSADNVNFSSTLSVNPSAVDNKTIYVKFSPSASGVFSGTITHNSGSVSKTVSLSGEAIDPSALTFHFNTCSVSSVPGSGFLSVNLTGSQKWGCSQFGRNSTNGVDINGYAGSAQTNDAWLISPALNLNAISNIPVLSFYSRGEFSGPKLQLYVSTTYSGSGVPNLDEWTEITTANFPTPPGSATAVWTLSDNIDLSAYKSAAKLYLAFRYTSSPAAGAARWSVDDIAVTDQSSLVNVSPSQLNFGEVKAGEHSASQTINLLSVGGSDLSVVPPAGYEVSVDNNSFTSQPLLITEAQAKAGLPVYVRFSPTEKRLKIEGSIRLSAEGLNKDVVAVTGSSYPKSETLDVACYNLSFFGAGSANDFTPQQRATQVANITTVMQRMNVDVFGVEEVSSDEAMSQLVANMPGYASVLSPRWSYSFNPPDPTFPPQKIGFVYNTNTLTLSTEEPPRVLFESLYDSARLNLEGHRLNDYPTGTPSSFWGSGRLPYMATFLASINGITKKIRVVVIHAKSGSTQSDYQRRLYDAQLLKDSLDAFYGNDELIIVGDYNDRMIKSIYTGSTTSSFLPFVNDVSNYTVLTKPLDEAGRTSFPSSNGLIDHLTASNEMVADYIGNSIDIEDPRAYVSPYTSVTASDHLPVYARFELHPCFVAAPATVSGPAEICPAATALTYSIEPVATATTYKWTVPQGWTIQSGQGSTSITVDATATAGEISVVAGNLCGSSPATVLPVAIETEKPVIGSCPVVPVQCYNASGNYTIPALAATDNCGAPNVHFVITGATVRTGTGANASGLFKVGNSTIAWTVTDAAGNTATCSTTVVVNSPVLSTVSNVPAITGGAINTLYKGYGPDAATLQGTVTGGTAPYTYKWTIGSSAGQALNSTASYTVSPASTTSYTFNAKDAYGCAAAVAAKTINVVDVRCGAKLDKITVCEMVKGKPTTSCVSEKDVAKLLAAGASLGACVTTSAVTTSRTTDDQLQASTLRVMGSPNPTRHTFQVQVATGNLAAPLSLRVVDLLGRTIEKRNSLAPNSRLTIGENYRPGVYIVEVTQDGLRTQLKFWKQ